MRMKSANARSIFILNVEEFNDSRRMSPCPHFCLLKYLYYLTKQRNYSELDYIFITV